MNSLIFGRLEAKDKKKTKQNKKNQQGDDLREFRPVQFLDELDKLITRFGYSIVKN